MIFDNSIERHFDERAIKQELALSVDGRPFADDYQSPGFIYDPIKQELWFPNAINNKGILQLIVDFGNIHNLRPIHTDPVDYKKLGIKKVVWNKYTDSLNVSRWGPKSRLDIRHKLFNIGVVKMHDTDPVLVPAFLKRIGNPVVNHLYVCTCKEQDPILLIPNVAHLIINRLEDDGQHVCGATDDQWLYNTFVHNPSLNRISVRFVENLIDRTTECERSMFMRIYESNSGVGRQYLMDNIQWN